MDLPSRYFKRIERIKTNETQNIPSDHRYAKEIINGFDKSVKP
jgi:hypothetical protein